jgi:hypothetical protein
MHVIWQAGEGFRLSEILRGFKKFSVKKTLSMIEMENKSRKVWMLWKFEFSGKRLKQISKY